MRSTRWASRASCVFTGQRPAEEVPATSTPRPSSSSPRSTGTNTPLKIYQYLRSGRPIVATNLRTHTQVLVGRDGVSRRTDSPSAFGAAILRAHQRPGVAAARVGGAREHWPRPSTATRRSSPRRSIACGLLVRRDERRARRRRDAPAPSARPRPLQLRALRRSRRRGRLRRAAVRRTDRAIPARSQQRLLLDALAPVAGERVIDVGTGTGRAAIGLAQAGAIVTGVDASVEMLDVARGERRGRGRRL